MNEERRWRNAAVVAVAAALSSGAYSVFVAQASAADMARAMFLSYVVAFVAVLIVRR